MPIIPLMKRELWDNLASLRDPCLKNLGKAKMIIIVNYISPVMNSGSICR